MDERKAGERPTGAAAVLGPTLAAVVAPERCWAQLGQRPALVAWVLLWLSALTTALAFVNLPITGSAWVVAARLGAERQGAQLGAEQLEAAERTAALYSKLMAAASPLIVLLMVALMAALIWAGAILLGGEASFARSLAVAGAAGFIHPGLATVYATIVLQLDPPTIRRPEDLAALSPSAGLDLLFAGADLPAWLRALLARVDLFNLWWVVLVASGSAALLGLSRGAGRTLAVGIWLLTALLASGAAALGTLG